ncbi:unnamed protein product, partial [Staurois parvus]
PVYGLQLKCFCSAHSAIGLLIVVLPTLLLGGLFNIGLCMAFNLSCLRFATLPWAPVPPPHCCCQVQSVSWVPGLVSRLHGGVEFVIGINCEGLLNLGLCMAFN